ncbi:MAG TPA: RNA polymerase sigma factor RpoD/SigA [Verrucomicrobiae bacterium]|nr:RNA polymerase sigma factor RpoD/SigA [Verrucomicrobiae bacterium]
MKLETTLKGHPLESPEHRETAAPRKKSQGANLGRITRLRPAKLTPGRAGFGKTGKGRRGAVQEEVAGEPVVMFNDAAETAASEADSNSQSPRGDNLQLYLREIGQVQLLTPEQEVELAKRIQKGDEEAREHMIKANLRLVVKIARDYEGLGLPLLDLINEGNIGLMKGVERFNPAKGAKLSTYAALWIKQAIRRALGNQSKTIRLPVHVVDKMAQIRLAERKLREGLGRVATDEEVASEMGFSLRQVKLYREAGKAPVSLDAPITEGEDGKQVAEVVADPNAVAAYDQMVKEGDSQLLQEVLGTLSERERNILNLRFGLSGETPLTLEEVGEQYGLTRERIRQIQEEALLRLRHKMKEKDSLPEEALEAAV